MKRHTQATIGALLLLACAYGVSVPQRGHADGSTWSGTPQQAFLDGPIVRKYQCTTCHTVTDQGGSVGPILNLVGLRRSEDWLRAWLRDPNAVKPGTKMPKFPLSEAELEQTVQSLSRMTRALQTEAILARRADPVETGRALFEDYDCRACHRLGDQGRFVGPDLTWVGRRKPEAWERVWLRDPPAFRPGTFMPDFGIPEPAVQALAAYLHTLQGQDNAAARDWEFMVNFTIDNDAQERGELVFKRLACWSCHGDAGRGGVANPNASQKTVPHLEGVRDAFTLEAFGAWLAARQVVASTDSGATLQPYACPDYDGALEPDEVRDLFAYVASLAPRRSRWKVK